VACQYCITSLNQVQLTELPPCHVDVELTWQDQKAEELYRVRPLDSKERLDMVDGIRPDSNILNVGCPTDILQLTTEYFDESALELPKEGRSFEGNAEQAGAPRIRRSFIGDSVPRAPL
jgi:hypothetical protein